MQWEESWFWSFAKLWALGEKKKKNLWAFPLKLTWFTFITFKMI